MTTSEATPRPWMLAGFRHISPTTMSKAGLDVYAISTHHPAGSWESVFAYKAQDATLIVTAVNAFDDLIAVLGKAEDLLDVVGSNRVFSLEAVALRTATKQVRATLAKAKRG